MGRARQTVNDCSPFLSQERFKFSSSAFWRHNKEEEEQARAAVFVLDQMEPIVSIVDGIKGLAKSADGFLKDTFFSRKRNDSPVEILKRLQREVFSDLLKLRDRQEKVERVLSLYKSGKGSPFQESSTHMKGIVEIGGALILAGSDAQKTLDVLDKGGIRTGINLKFIFETLVRQKDALLAEFMTMQSNLKHEDDVSGIPLELVKMKYSANINDILTLNIIPLGAQLKDFGSTFLDNQGQEFFLLGTPLFREYHNFAAGVTFKGSNFAASFGQLVSGLSMQIDNAEAHSSLSSIAKATFLPLEGMEVSLSALWKVPRPPSQLFKFSKLTTSLGSLGHIQESPSGSRDMEDGVSTGTLALTLESYFDQGANTDCWVEIQKSNPRVLKWGACYSDVLENGVGWGCRVGGEVKEHALLEAFLNIRFGNRFSLQPRVGLVIAGDKRTPALMVHSRWSM